MFISLNRIKIVVNSKCWIFLLIFLWSKEASAQFSFDFMQTPITDTVKFNHEYDFIGKLNGSIHFVNITY